MQVISREELIQRLGSGEELALVEVLQPERYREFHLPGAVNVPVDDRFDEQIQQAVPDKTSPVVLYCLDTECQAAPKAARRMEDLGYRKVYDYTAGKLDWKEAGLPVLKGDRVNAES